VIWYGTAGRLANRAQRVFSLLGTDWHLRDVGPRSDEISPGGNIFATLAVLQCPRFFGALQLLEVGLAITEGRTGPGSHIPATASDGEDDGGRHEETKREFSRFEGERWVFGWLGYWIIHRYISAEMAGE
jgi:hypothetical protein